MKLIRFSKLLPTILFWSLLLAWCTNTSTIETIPSTDITSTQTIQTLIEPTQAVPTSYDSPSQMFSLEYDTAKRRPTQQRNQYSEFERIFWDGNAYAMIITENVTLTTEQLESAALQNAKAVDPQASIISKQQKRIQGQDALYLELVTKIDNKEFIYKSLYISNQYGTVQFITHTLKSLYGDYGDELQTILDGLQLRPITAILPWEQTEQAEQIDNAQTNQTEQNTPTPNEETENNKPAYTVDYDTQKRVPFTTPWSQADLQLQHISEQAFITFVVEQRSMDLESYKTAAINNMTKVAQSVEILYEEPVVINGNNMWMAKIAAKVNDIDLIYLTYYYAWDNILAQFSSFTSSQDFETYKEDIKQVLDTVDM